MNTTNLKAIRAIKRLAAIAKKQTPRNISQTSTFSILVSQPCINKLYLLDFEQAGAMQKNVVARYTGKSKSGRFMNFQPVSLFTLQGMQIHLLSLSAMPLKIKLLKETLFACTNNAA